MACHMPMPRSQRPRSAFRCHLSAAGAAASRLPNRHIANAKPPRNARLRSANMYGARELFPSAVCRSPVHGPVSCVRSARRPRAASRPPRRAALAPHPVPRSGSPDSSLDSSSGVRSQRDNRISASLSITAYASQVRTRLTLTRATHTPQPHRHSAQSTDAPRSTVVGSRVAPISTQYRYQLPAELLLSGLWSDARRGRLWPLGGNLAARWQSQRHSRLCTRVSQEVQSPTAHALYALWYHTRPHHMRQATSKMRQAQWQVCVHIARSDPGLKPATIQSHSES